MADTTQLNSGEHALRDNTDDEPLTLDPDLVAEISNYDFLDINDEDAEYQRLFAVQAKAAFTANVSEVPALALPALSDGPSTSASCANSTIASRTPEPEHNEGHCKAGDARGHDEPRNADHDFGFDDFIDPSAYELSETVKAEQSMALPYIPHRHRSEPSVRPTARVRPHPLSSPPASALLSSPAEPSHELVRSISKRGRQDTSNDLASTTEKPIGKRLKQQKGGYPCPGCAERFDRACDQKKHFQRTHKPKDQHPHACPHCRITGMAKSFLYPKDLRRHFKQVHNIDTTSVSPDRKPSNPSPVSETAPSKPLGLRVLFKAVMSLKKLRITATSPQHKLIMVSHDQKSFTEVEVFDVFTPVDLVSKMLEPLKFDGNSPIQWVQAQTYSRQYGRVKLGQKLDAQSIFNLVMKDADSQGSLKLFISTADGYGDYSA